MFRGIPVRRGEGYGFTRLAVCTSHACRSARSAPPNQAGIRTTRANTYRDICAFVTEQSLHFPQSAFPRPCLAWYRLHARLGSVHPLPRSHPIPASYSRCSRARNTESGCTRGETIRYREISNPCSNFSAPLTTVRTCCMCALLFLSGFPVIARMLFSLCSHTYPSNRSLAVYRPLDPFSTLRSSHSLQLQHRFVLWIITIVLSSFAEQSTFRT